jgi:hypothetical protein
MRSSEFRLVPVSTTRGTSQSAQLSCKYRVKAYQGVVYVDGELVMETHKSREGRLAFYEGRHVNNGEESS